MGPALALGGFGGIFLFLAAILTFLIPFFIFRIRNESIQTNRRLEQIYELLAESIKQKKEIPLQLASDDVCNDDIACEDCGQIYKESELGEDMHCLTCGGRVSATISQYP